VGKGLNWLKKSVALNFKFMAVLTEALGDFLSPFRQMPGWYLKLGFSHILSSSYSVVMMLYSLCYCAAALNKLI
jgi:hypothetical protein